MCDDELPDWVFSAEDRRYMAQALELAEAAASVGEVPVGAVLVAKGEILAAQRNRRIELSDPTAHAEILALREAGAASGDWRLEGAVLYVTLEPCPMCTAACREARLAMVVWGAADRRAGACGSALDLAESGAWNRKLVQRGGLEAEASKELLDSFFRTLRKL